VRPTWIQKESVDEGRDHKVFFPAQVNILTFARRRLLLQCDLDSERVVISPTLTNNKFTDEAAVAISFGHKLSYAQRWQEFQ
jgi:hypothetical protein